MRGTLTIREHPVGPPARYRLEHRRPTSVRLLAGTDDEATGRAAFRVHAARLEATGASGRLVLVEAATGLVVTWYVLTPRPHGTPS